MFRRAAIVAPVAVASRCYGATTYTKPVRTPAERLSMLNKDTNAKELRYDLLGPRRNTQTRIAAMSDKMKAKTDVATLDDLTGRTASEPAVRWVEDPKNWAALNKQDWADMKKNDNKNYVLPRMSQ